VPDAKLVGKRVRITCKRCGTVLLVDGTVNPPRIASGANAGPSVAPVARTSLPPVSSPPPAERAVPQASVQFLVVMADDRQESADVAQIVRLYRDRQINAESLVWREGMDDWKSVWDVEEIAVAFRRMGYARPSRPSARPSKPAQASYEDSSDDASTHVVPSSHPPTPSFDEDEATSVVDSSRIPFDAPVAGYGRVGGEEDDPTGVVPSPMDLSLSPDVLLRVPAQRASGRSDRPARTQERAVRAEPTPSPEPAQAQNQTRARAQTRKDSRAGQQGLDLFAVEAQWQAQQELQPAVEDDGARLTGARGENSVLFSLDALVRQEQQQKHRPLVLPPRARTDESVLVDSSPSLPSGVAGSPLIAPDFTAPVSAPPPRMATALDDIQYPAQKRRGGWLLPVGVIVVAGAAAGGWMSGKLQPVLKAAGLPVSVPSAETARSAAPEGSATPPSSAAEAASAEPEASASPSASASASAAPSATAVAKAATPKPQAPRESGTAEPKGSDETAAPKETAAKPSGGGDFDTAAAKTALTAAANNASSCREATGPMGSGKVSITFAPSGRPTSVAVTGDLAGTSVGSCVARLFRAVRVPAFSGDPVSVSKTFSVK
jgi:hypothetical protein